MIRKMSRYSSVTNHGVPSHSSRRLQLIGALLYLLISTTTAARFNRNAESRTTHNTPEVNSREDQMLDGEQRRLNSYFELLNGASENIRYMLPTELGRLEKLQSGFYFGTAMLLGEVPSQLAQMTSLTAHFDISENYLCEDLPSQVYSCTCHYIISWDLNNLITFFSRTHINIYIVHFYRDTCRRRYVWRYLGLQWQ